MANTYESKFKGVEIDDGVNIATYATGTGGINVTIKGTTNVTGTGGRHLEIDGSGVKITPVSGTGTSTTDVMSQKAVTDELGKKQDTITATTKIKAGSLDLTGNAFIGGQLSCNDTSGSRLLLSIGYPEGSYYVFGPQTAPYHTGLGTYFPSNGGILATTADITSAITGKQDKLTAATGITITTGNTIYCNGDLTGITVNTETINVGTELNLSGNLVQGGETFTFPNTGGQLVTLPYLNNYQDKLTTSSEISIKKLQATTIGAQDNGSLTIVDPLTVSNDVYVNELEATKGVFSSGAIVQGTLTGETAHFATGVTVDGYSSFNGIYVDNSTTKPICFKRNGSIVTKMYGPTSGGGELVNVYLPGKGGTLALTSDIPTGGGGTTITADGVVKTAMNASSTGGIKTLVMTDKLGHFWVTGGIGSLFVDSELFTASETTEKNYRTEIVSTGIRFCSDAHTPPDLDEGSWLTLHGPTAISGGSFSHTIYLPQKSGTVALLSDITGGGSAGVSSIGGKTGAITLGTGLTMSGQQLTPKVKNIYKDSSNYLCIDTN